MIKCKLLFQVNYIHLIMYVDTIWLLWQIDGMKKNSKLNAKIKKKILLFMVRYSRNVLKDLLHKVK